MSDELPFNIEYCSSYAGLFSHAFLEKLTSHTGVNPFARLATESGLRIPAEMSLQELLATSYNVLKQHYRCEFVYKVELARALHEEWHSSTHPGLLTEFSALSSKADVVIVNGSTTAYEIKTALDSIQRLASQLESYKYVFEYVYVVTHPALSEQLLSTLDPAVGIYRLNPDNTCEQLRVAASNLAHLKPAAIFDCLRQKEFTAIIESEFGQIDDIPNTRIYRYCKERFVTLDIEVVHEHFVNALKKRSARNAAVGAVADLPFALQFLLLTASYTRPKLALVRDRLTAAVPIRTAN